MLVACLERASVKLRQIRRIAGSEERPGGVLRQNAVRDRLQPLHEQVGNPVGRIHVMRAPPVVPGLLAQIEKVLDVRMPKLQIGAERAGPLAALIHGDGDIVADLQKWDDA